MEASPFAGPSGVGFGAEGGDSAIESAMRADGHPAASTAAAATSQGSGGADGGGGGGGGGGHKVVLGGVSTGGGGKSNRRISLDGKHSKHGSTTFDAGMVLLSQALQDRKEMQQNHNHTGGSRRMSGLGGGRASVGKSSAVVFD